MIQEIINTLYPNTNNKLLKRLLLDCQIIINTYRYKHDKTDKNEIIYEDYVQ